MLLKSIYMATFSPDRVPAVATKRAMGARISGNGFALHGRYFWQNSLPYASILFWRRSWGEME